VDSVGIVVQDEPEVRYYAAAGGDVPGAAVWQTGKVNVWIAQHRFVICGLPPVTSLIRYTCAFAGTDGDTLRGELLPDAKHESNCAVLSGSFWMVHDGLNLRGAAVTNVSGPCGTQPDTTALDLSPWPQ
jgi:hypothetical protein